MKLNVVILAAGKGTRFCSNLPKVLQVLAGRPLLSYVIECAKQLMPQNIYVVCGDKSQQVRDAFPDEPVTWIYQEHQLGTADAVKQVLPHLEKDSYTLVLSGDVPLLTLETLQALIEQARHADLALLIADVENPTGLGRIIRDKGNRIIDIVEEKDATSEQKKVKQVYSGVMIAATELFQMFLPEIDCCNAQKEYYLTKLPFLAISRNYHLESFLTPDSNEILGINTRVELAALERQLQKNQALNLLFQGVTLLDPNRFDLRGEVTVLGQDIVIDVNVILEGKVSLGNNVQIGAHSIIRNAVLADDVVIKPNSIVDGAEIGQGSVVGPFARIRPQSYIAEQVRIGNFVELKQAQIDQGSKVCHLSYIGDAIIGKKVNIGAGTITCNYDGQNKYKTTVKDNAFIGSNSALIAPVTIGESAVIGAGSTISEDAPDQTLTIARSRQVNIKDWKNPVVKAKSEA